MDFNPNDYMIGIHGNLIKRPVCPHCGCSISLWAVQAMQHTRHCQQNPTVIAEQKKFLDDLVKKMELKNEQQQ